MKQLMHPRETGNFSAKGYYPTDNGTMLSILSMIDNEVTEGQDFLILDPCVGTGEAVMAFSEKWPAANYYGIEIDDERAVIAGKNLNQVIKGSAYSTHVSPGSVDVLFLNPPYGRSVKGQLEDDTGTGRLEHDFIKHCFGWIAPGGLLVYIIPKSQMTDKIVKYLITRFKNCAFFAAAVDTYKQVVFMGEKLPYPRSVDQELLAKVSSYRLMEKWPRRGDYKFYYAIKPKAKTFNIYSVELTVEGLSQVKAKIGGLWPQFKSHVGGRQKHDVIPLHKLTDWHISLLITSGLISGVVDNGRQKLLIKGRTVKVKKIKHFVEESEESVAEITEKKDVFQTVMKAVVLNPGPDFGKLLTIK